MSKSTRDEKLEKLKDWGGWLKEFQNESDRAMAVLGAAFADAKLEELLRAYLVDDKKEVNGLMGAEKPLGSFGARSKIAYCLGLISPNQYNDLKCIAKIRNMFAHNLHGLDFNNPTIGDLVSNFKVPKSILSSMDKYKLDNRSMYLLSCVQTAIWIELPKLSLKGEKRLIKNEPDIAS